MSVEENKALIRRQFEDWSSLGGNVSKIRVIMDAYVAPRYIYHGGAHSQLNREQALEGMVAMLSALPDFRMSIHDQLAEGDMVATRYTWQGTHRGTFMGIAATGRQIVVKGIEINRIAEGKVVETWDFLDSMDLMTQLGIVPKA